MKRKVYNMVLRPTMMCGLALTTKTRSRVEDAKIFVRTDWNGKEMRNS